MVVDEDYENPAVDRWLTVASRLIRNPVNQLLPGVPRFGARLSARLKPPRAFSSAL